MQVVGLGKRLRLQWDSAKCLDASGVRLCVILDPGSREDLLRRLMWLLLEAALGRVVQV